MHFVFNSKMTFLSLVCAWQGIDSRMKHRKSREVFMIFPRRIVHGRKQYMEGSVLRKSMSPKQKGSPSLSSLDCFMTDVWVGSVQ